MDKVAPCANALLLSELLSPSKRTHVRVTSITSVNTTASVEDLSENYAKGEDKYIDKRQPLTISSRELPSQHAPPVRHTFVDFPLQRFVMRRVVSAPGTLTMESPTNPMPTSTMCPSELREVLGSSQLPTIGSAGHGKRRCRPCAFFWREGSCQTGPHCKFCHLCGADEKKLRRKERVAGKAQRGWVNQVQR